MVEEISRWLEGVADIHVLTTVGPANARPHMRRKKQMIPHREPIERMLIPKGIKPKTTT